MVLLWEKIDCRPIDGGLFSMVCPMLRAKVPGGWFIQIKDTSNSGFFYPDLEHTWDGSSLP